MLRKLITVAAALFALGAFAAETPREAWIKAKCAVCHGEDGSGNTPEGKRRNVPDLRAPATQKRKDAELYDIIIAGHGSMPAFKTQVSRDRAALLVAYIRSFAKK